jgi:transposase
LRIDNIDVEAAIKSVQALLETDKSLTPPLKAALDMLLLLVTLLINQKGLNSKSSSIPPSSDPTRKKVSKAKSARKPVGHKGSKGTTLSKLDIPDEMIGLLIDRRTLPKGISFKAAGCEDSQGHRFTATFPEAAYSVRKQHQGTDGLYVSIPLVPVGRVREHLDDQIGVPVSAGSICNVNLQAYNGLARFDGGAKQQPTSRKRVNSKQGIIIFVRRQRP